jgi:hypothetical protein
MGVLSTKMISGTLLKLKEKSKENPRLTASMVSIGQEIGYK